MLGTSTGSTISAPWALRSAIASAITLACSGFNPPCGVFSPGGVTASKKNARGTPMRLPFRPSALRNGV